MAERFLKFIPSKAAMEFALKYKNAFILLLIIAERARRTGGEPDGLTIGQCHLGNHKSYDMTEKEYRYAKQILVEQGLIKIILTNRTRKKCKRRIFLNSENIENEATERATEVTTTGTLVELCNSDVWDINSENDNHQKGDRKGDLGATEGRLKGDKQEGIRRNKKEEEEEKDIAQPAARLHKTNDILYFDSEKGEYAGITEKDLTDWRTIYPHIDLTIELTKSITWLKSNPSKSKKSLWRKFISNWLNRANDTAHNKKAYQAAGSAQGTDRLTKDINGNPVENQYEGRF